MKNIFKQSSFKGEIEPCTFYLGVDPTSPQLHIGHYYLFKVCEFLISNGFKMILLIGDKTAKIGDPTDKLKTRKLLNDKEVSYNIKQILQQLPKLDYAVIHNSEFTHDLGYFSHFSLSTLLKNSTFKRRLESEEGVSLLEFIYPVIQGLDFYFLNKHYEVKLQLGGQDQWFNMVTGLNFLNRGVESNCNIATLPLITTNKGAKIGKTENKLELSPYETWQFFRNVRDENVIEILQTITSNFETTEDINDLKIKLADIMVEFIFSKEEAEVSKNKAFQLFNQKKII